MLSLGIKYSSRDLIRDVNYRGVKLLYLSYYNLNDVSANPLAIVCCEFQSGTIC